MTNACHGCAERREGCHALCPKYAAFKAALAERKAAQKGMQDFEAYQRVSRAKMRNARRKETRR